MNKYLLIMAVLLVHASYVSASEKKNSEEAVLAFSYTSYSKAIIVSLEYSLSGDGDLQFTDPGGLIILLGSIDSARARKILIQLLEVYMGSANYEALSYAIYLQGNRIKDDLKNILGTEVRCDLLKQIKANKSIPLRCINKELRDEIIQSLISDIENKTKYEYPL